LFLLFDTFSIGFPVPGLRRVYFGRFALIKADHAKAKGLVDLIGDDRLVFDCPGDEELVANLSVGFGSPIPHSVVKSPRQN
jgi:hypothetical protein